MPLLLLLMGRNKYTIGYFQYFHRPNSLGSRWISHQQHRIYSIAMSLYAYAMNTSTYNADMIFPLLFNSVFYNFHFLLN